MKTKYFILLFFAISIVPLLDLFHPGLPITHDGQDHVARIANFYQNLAEGNIIPRWAANLNWGYGHPILMFLYPLPSYMASLLHAFGFSFVDSTKIVFGFTFLLSGIAMYLWIRSLLGEKAGLVAGLLYMFAPYRFVDLYVRGAIGEHVAFVFPPLVFYFLLKLAKKHSVVSIVGGAVVLAGLILSHNAVSLMFLPLLALYALLLLMRQQRGRLTLLFDYVSLVGLGLGLSAFFWFPAFFEGRYTLRDIVTKGEYVSRLVEFKSLLYGDWNYGITGQFTTQVGLVQWLMVVLSAPTVIWLRKKRSILWIQALGSLLIFATTLFLMTSASRFIWEIVTTLQKFQFPWRFLSVAVFITSVLGGFFVATLPKKKQLVTCFLMLVLLLWTNKDYWHAKDFLLKDESFYTSVYTSTTDTGESSPIWSVRFMEQQPKAHMEIITGSATIREGGRTSVEHSYLIDARTKTRLRENTLYFPGWNVLVNGRAVPIEFQDPANRGLITFFVEQGQHAVQVRFGETRVRFFSNTISAIALVTLTFLLWKRFRWF